MSLQRLWTQKVIYRPTLFALLSSLGEVPCTGPFLRAGLQPNIVKRTGRRPDRIDSMASFLSGQTVKVARLANVLNVFGIHRPVSMEH